MRDKRDKPLAASVDGKTDAPESAADKLPLKYAALSAALRKRGFHKDYDSRAGGVRCTIFVKEIDKRRTVEVQLWSESGHRASHSFNGCSDTAPTDFRTIQELDEAIRVESTRMDGSYSLATPTESAALADSSTATKAEGQAEKGRNDN